MNTFVGLGGDAIDMLESEMEIFLRRIISRLQIITVEFFFVKIKKYLVKTQLNKDKNTNLWNIWHYCDSLGGGRELSTNLTWAVNQYVH